MKKSFILLFLLPFVAFSGYGQIAVTPNNVATQLVQKLVGFGVTSSNETLVCGDPATVGTDYPSGIFTVTSSNLGLDSGIVLTSGAAATNTAAFTSGVNGAPTTVFASNVSYPFAAASGDADLTQLVGGVTKDKCILEFDFTTIGDSVKFNYVFGSEEYTSYTCSSFNDVFGFFLSGPGITGPFSNNSKNLALVPGSTTCPVAISTIFCPNSAGCCQTTQYCFGNTPGCGAFSAANNTCAYFVCNTSATGTVSYNGFTVVLKAESQIIPCSTYHIKIAIADKSDQVLDSGVFLQAGSFSSNVVDVNLTTGLSSLNGNPVLVEGCDTSNKLVITREIYGGIVSPDTVSFLIQGSASNGIDYTLLPTQAFFTGNGSGTDTLITWPLQAFSDGITEGTEFIKIYILSGCMSMVIDSVIIEIRDSLEFNMVTPSTAICLGQSVTTSGTFDNGLTFQWSPASNMTNPTGLVTTITPTTVGSQTYSLTGTYMDCPSVTQSFVITTDPNPIITPLTDMELCEGKTLTLTASVSPAFNYNYTWNPNGNLINQINTPNGSTVTFNGTSTQTLQFTATSPNAGCTASDDVILTVWPFMQGQISPDTLVCNAEPVQLWVTGGIGQYQWYPAATLSCEFCPNPVATALGTTIYYAVLLEPHGCQDTLQTIVENHPPFNLVLANNDTTFSLENQ